jgi:hypothetical protein
MAQGKLIEAGKELDEALSQRLLSTPLSGDLLTLKAGLGARQLEWAKASADAVRSFENQPLSSGRYSMVAALLLKTKQFSAYQQFCGRILTLSGGTSNIFTADQVAKSCLFSPGSGVDLSKVAGLADMAVTLGAGDEGAMPFFRFCKGLSEYRQGHFNEAAEWAQKSISSGRKQAQAPAYGLLAMTSIQLGRKDDARTALAEGEKLAPAVMPNSVAQNMDDAWIAWLFARIPLDEAITLLGDDSFQLTSP